MTYEMWASKITFTISFCWFFSHITLWFNKLPATNEKLLEFDLSDVFFTVSITTSITTTSILNDCEFDAILTSCNVYWEGAIKVTGTHTGQGFMELSGYGNDKNRDGKIVNNWTIFRSANKMKGYFNVV